MAFPFFALNRKAAISLNPKISSNADKPAARDGHSIPFFVKKGPKSSSEPIRKNNTISINAGSDGKKQFELVLPSLFGTNMLASASFRTPGTGHLCFKVPSSTLGPNSTSLSYKRTDKNINDKNLKMDILEVSYGSNTNNRSIGMERINKLVVFYTQCAKNILGIKATAKCGVTKCDRLIPFFKGMLEKQFKFSRGMFFAESSLRCGRLYGQTNLVERFFLGSGTRGYKEESISPVAGEKKIGGKSFIELRTQTGIQFQGLRLFVFADRASCAVDGITESFQLIHGGKDEPSLGKSVGCGISLADGKGLSFIYSVLLTENKEIDRYYLGMDLAF